MRLQEAHELTGLCPASVVAQDGGDDYRTMLYLPAFASRWFENGGRWLAYDRSELSGVLRAQAIL